ncbi:MAG: DNA polymerase IV [Bacteroidetes bacterium]|nr:DNA polymerase IV [Bacteroidota bacterium]
MGLRLASSQFWIDRNSDKFLQTFRRVRLMPLYSMPHIKDLDLNLRDNTRKIFFHMDIDCFFAQVEERDNPKFKGQPISVGGWGEGAGGIVMTCNYEARKRGVDTGMSVVQAKMICPKLISLPCDGVKYESIIFDIQDVVKKYFPEDCMEQYSIDECFWDGSQIFRDINEAEKFAIKLKEEIYKRQKLTVSIGLSYNKSYAKMATKFNKPNGLSVVRPSDKEKLIYPLPCDKLWGIAHRMYRRFLGMNIITLGDLANCNSHRIRKEFGINGIVLQKCAKGLDTSGIFVKPENSEKMIGHHNTLHKGINDKAEILKELRSMCEYVARKLRYKNLVTGRIFLYMRYENLMSFAEEYKLPMSGAGEYKLPFYTNDDEEIFLASFEILKNFQFAPGRFLKLKMTGVNCTDLHKDTGERNLNLFSQEKNLPFKEMDILKMKYGEKIIRLGLS